MQARIRDAWRFHFTDEISPFFIPALPPNYFFTYLLNLIFS